MFEDTKYFSRNLLIRKVNQEYELLHISGQYLSTFSFNYDEKHCSFKYTFLDVAKGFDVLNIFNEIITSMILDALTHSIKEIILKSLPINERELYIIFKKFKNTYKDSVAIVEIELGLEELIQQIIIKLQLQKNTHFIQQAYLRNFSSNIELWKPTNKKKKARIFVFSKYKNSEEVIGNTTTELKYGLKILNIAKEDYFYTIVMEQLMRQTYEKNTPPILDKLIRSKTTKGLIDEEKRNIVDYIILTWQRSKEARKCLKESWEKIFKIFAEDYKGKKIPPNIRIEANPEFLRRTQEEMIIRFLYPKSEHYKTISSRLLNLNWRIIKTNSPYFFLTSDNPVVFYNSYYEKEKRKGNDYITKKIQNFKNLISLNDSRGIIEFKGDLGKAPMAKGIEIYLPISPRICLCIFDKIDSMKPLIPTKINREIILQADEYIFSHQKRFGFIKKILSKNPEYINRDGRRQEIKASFKKGLNNKNKYIKTTEK